MLLPARYINGSAVMRPADTAWEEGSGSACGWWELVWWVVCKGAVSSQGGECVVGEAEATEIIPSVPGETPSP